MNQVKICIWECTPQKVLRYAPKRKRRQRNSYKRLHWKLSFWQHWKLSFWQPPVQPATKISTLVTTCKLRYGISTITCELSKSSMVERGVQAMYMADMTVRSGEQYWPNSSQCIDSLGQVYSDSIANALELPQSCVKPSIYGIWYNRQRDLSWCIYIYINIYIRSRAPQLFPI